MRFLEALRAEHALIDLALGSFRTWAQLRVVGSGDPADGAGFRTFFIDWAGQHHHAREEEVLFPALTRRLELPSEQGPLAVLSGDHRRLGGLLEQLSPLLMAGGDPHRVQALVIDYSRGLWLHIDAENSVLLPEAEFRLVRAGVRELPEPVPNALQRAAREKGEALTARYPPMEDPAIVRGEGCVICPAYGTRCEGLEREWWTASEWDELPDRIG